MPKRILFAIILLFSFTSVVFASPIRLQADKQGMLDLKEQVFVGIGNVLLEDDDISVRAHEVNWYIEQDEVIFKGNVRLKQGDFEFVGESLVYNLKTSTGQFVDVKSSLELEQAVEPVFIYGELADIDGDNFFLTSGTITTCDLEESHYGLRVKSLDIYPGDRMVIRHVTFYEGPLPLFYWPYLVISLDPESRQRAFSLPQIGYGAREGWFVKNSYSYYHTPNFHGDLHLDYYQNLGVGGGVTHNYGLSELGEGQLFLYTIPSIERFRASLDHGYESDSLTLNFAGQYFQENDEVGVFQQDTDLSGDFAFQGDTVRFTGKGNLTKDHQADSDKWAVKGDWRQDLSDNLRLTLTGDVDERNERRLVNYLTETRFTTERGNYLTLAVQQRYNPALLDEEATANWSSVNRVPEVTLTVPRLSFIPGRLDLGVGQFREFPADFQAVRTTGTYQWNDSYRLSDTTLRLRSNLQGSYYSTEQSQRSWYGEASTTTRFNPQLSLTTRYRRREVWGETPFRFDREKVTNDLTGTVNLSLDPVTFRVGSGYDFEKEEYNNLAVNAQYRQGALSANVGTTYNLNTEQLGVLTSLVRYRADSDTEVSLGSQYNLEEKTWKRIDGKVALDLTDMVSISYEGIYDFKKEEFTRGQFGVGFDLHCREINLRYDQVGKTIWLEYVLTAFPDIPFRVTRSEEGTLFEYDELTKIIDELQ